MDLSIVVPVYNEEESIRQLYEELTRTVQKITKKYEILLVDDGSTDSSHKLMRDLAEKDAHVAVVRLRKNFGQTPALMAGFNTAKGEVIVTLDADLQNDPADIPRLLEKLAKGYDVVCGWRMQRNDNVFKKIPSKFSNWLNRKITGTSIHDSGCTLRAYKRKAIEGIQLYGENHRYIPAIIGGRGFKVTEIVTHHRQRKFGKSKYGIARLLKGMLDLLALQFLLKYSNRPMHVLGSLGMGVLLLGFLSGIYLLIEKFYYGKAIASRPMLSLTVLLGILGIQLFFTGVLAEMVVRTGHNVKETYSIEHTYRKNRQ